MNLSILQLFFIMKSGCFLVHSENSRNMPFIDGILRL